MGAGLGRGWGAACGADGAQRGGRVQGGGSGFTAALQTKDATKEHAPAHLNAAGICAQLLPRPARSVSNGLGPALGRIRPTSDADLFLRRGAQATFHSGHVVQIFSGARAILSMAAPTRYPGAQMTAQTSEPPQISWSLQPATRRPLFLSNKNQMRVSSAVDEAKPRQFHNEIKLPDPPAKRSCRLCVLLT